MIRVFDARRKPIPDLRTVSPRAGPAVRVTDHDPYARPLGCNGKYGRSGARAHRYRGEPACTTCLKAEAHHTREYRTGGIRKGRRLQPCGTNAAAMRHRKHKQPLCFPCRVAEAAHRLEGKARRATKPCAKQPANSNEQRSNSNSNGVTA